MKTARVAPKAGKIPIKRGTKVFVKYWLPVYVYAGLIFAYSGQSSVPFVPKILLGDKLLHLLEYAILAYLLARAARNSTHPQLASNFRAFAVGTAFIYGFSDEIHQYFVPGRSAEALDLLADGLGAFIGAAFFRQL